MGGWTGEGKDTIIWDGDIKAKKFIGDTGAVAETDPVYSASSAALITSADIINLGNLSGTNTGDQNLSPYMQTASGALLAGATFTGQVVFKKGLVSEPSISFDTDTNSGWYYYLDGGTAWSANGVKVMHIAPTVVQLEKYLYMSSQRIEACSRIELADGNSGSPSITFTEDKDTGIYRANTNILGFTTAGTAQATLNADGKFTSKYFQVGDGSYGTTPFTSIKTTAGQQTHYKLVAVANPGTGYQCGIDAAITSSSTAINGRIAWERTNTPNSGDTEFYISLNDNTALTEQLRVYATGKLSVRGEIAAGSHIIPKTDNAVDLGSSTYEFKDIYIDGVAYVDAIKADDYQSSDGSSGQSVSQTIVTDVRDNAGQMQKKTQTLTFKNGLLTAQGAESDWTDTTDV